MSTAPYLIYLFKYRQESHDTNTNKNSECLLNELHFLFLKRTIDQLQTAQWGNVIHTIPPPPLKLCWTPLNGSHISQEPIDEGLDTGAKQAKLVRISKRSQQL